MPSGRPSRWRSLWVPLGSRTQEGSAESGGEVMTASLNVQALDISASAAATSGNSLDWKHIAEELDAYGCAVIKAVLSADQCSELVGRYPKDHLFRSRVVMSRHGFGKGEYKYFAYPLPELLAAQRTALYSPLAEIANRWNAALRVKARFPPGHKAYLKRCHAAGQRRPTPLILQYDPGDYNCLHQDLYGEHVF